MWAPEQFNCVGWSVHYSWMYPANWFVNIIKPNIIIHVMKKLKFLFMFKFWLSSFKDKNSELL